MIDKRLKEGSFIVISTRFDCKTVDSIDRVINDTGMRKRSVFIRMAVHKFIEQYEKKRDI